MDSSRSHLDRNVCNNMLCTQKTQQQYHTPKMIELYLTEAANPQHASLRTYKPYVVLNRGQMPVERQHITRQLCSATKLHTRFE